MVSQSEQWAGVSLQRLPIQEGVERALLGSLLIDRHAIENVAGLVRPEDFLINKHRTIYRAMLRAHTGGKASDIVTVTDALGVEGVAEVELPYLANLALSPPSSMGVYDYAEMVAEQGRKKTLMDAVNAAMGILNDSPHMPAAEVARILVGAIDDTDRGEVIDPADMVRVLTLNSMADVTISQVDWVWYPYIPRAKLVLIEGDPGLGKSTLTSVLAAAMSRGWPLPDQDEGRPPARVLLLADEDGLDDTVAPRLLALGADMHMIRPVIGAMQHNQELPLMLNLEGVRALEREIEDYRPALVVIDPLFAYMGGKVDINRGNEVRAVLRPMIEMCQRLDTTILALRHLNKGNGGPAIYRGQGNIDFLAAARSVLTVREDPDDAGRAVLYHTKSNLGPKGQALAFRLGNGAQGIEFLWEGPVDMNESDLFGVQEDNRTAVDEAKHFLLDALFEGPMGGKDVQRAAREAGVSERTLWRAKDRMKIRATKEPGTGRWIWSLPNLPEKTIVGTHGRDGRDEEILAETNGKSTLPTQGSFGRHDEAGPAPGRHVGTHDGRDDLASVRQKNGNSANSANSAKRWWDEDDDDDERETF